MIVLYSYDNNIYDWSDIEYKMNNDVLLKDSIKYIKKGDPLTCEYRTISIVSDKFDRFGKSEVMIVNYVKHHATKDIAMESITYYDNDIKGKKFKRDGKKYYKIIIGPFDSSEYGNSVCFHTPGYKGSTINITTKVWEIDEGNTLKKILDFIGKGIGLIEPVSPYLTIVNEAFNISSQVLTGFIKHTELCGDHTLELRLDSENHPLLVGKYICFPESDDLNEKLRIIKNYNLVNNRLYTLDNKGLYQEYDNTYYVIKVSNNTREDLANFDFTASSVDLLSKLNTNGGDNSNGITDDILELQKIAYDTTLIRCVQEDYDEYIQATENNKDDARLILVASYKQLQSSNSEELEWLNNTFPHIRESIQDLL